MVLSLVLIFILQIKQSLSVDSTCSGSANSKSCTPLTTDEKQAILDIHNELRDRVAGGGLVSEGTPYTRSVHTHAHTLISMQANLEQQI